MRAASNLVQEFNAITEHFSPRVIATANGQYVKLAKFKGEFPFHAHAEEDEFFLVHRGEFTMCYRDREVVLQAGDFHVVPRGVEHRPRAAAEAWVMLVETAATKHTRDTVTAFTKNSRPRTWDSFRRCAALPR
jgi:mannose-6-phosphate isomerase-like protein (cupin superfamily)